MRNFLLAGILTAATAMSGCAGSTSIYPLFSAETTTAQSRGFVEGFRYENGSGVPRNYERAEREYSRAAKFGDAKAMNNLGVMAIRGQGRNSSRSAATSFFNKAAANGSASAHFNLGLLHETGFSGPLRIDRATEEYRIAAEMGHAEAAYRLSVLLESGQALSAYPEEWRRFFDMAVARGHDTAIQRIDGVIQLSDVSRYLSSENCRECVTGPEFKMADRSLTGLDELSREGDPVAQYNLGVRYMNANGANHDTSEAARLFTLSARQGYAPAQRQLGQMHLRGEGVGRSKVLAHAWLNLASKQNDLESGLARSEMLALEQAMSTAEIRQAQDIAAKGARMGR